MATLYPRGKSWYLQWSEGGRQFRRSLGPISREEAENARTRKEIELKQGTCLPRLVYPIGTPSYATAPVSPRLDEIKRKSRYLLKQTRKNAKARGIPFTLGMEDLEALLDESGGYCQITGIEFDFEWAGGNRRPWTPSIDRIDSDSGYSLENCRLVCAMVNVAINEWGIEAFERLVMAVAENQTFNPRVWR